MQLSIAKIENIPTGGIRKKILPEKCPLTFLYLPVLIGNLAYLKKTETPVNLLFIYDP